MIKIPVNENTAIKDKAIKGPMKLTPLKGLIK
jgi:hypothetical protein